MLADAGKIVASPAVAVNPAAVAVAHDHSTNAAANAAAHAKSSGADDARNSSQDEPAALHKSKSATWTASPVAASRPRPVSVDILTRMERVVAAASTNTAGSRVQDAGQDELLKLPRKSVAGRPRTDAQPQQQQQQQQQQPKHLGHLRLVQGTWTAASASSTRTSSISSIATKTTQQSECCPETTDLQPRSILPRADMTDSPDTGSLLEPVSRRHSYSSHSSISIWPDEPTLQGLPLADIEYPEFAAFSTRYAAFDALAPMMSKDVTLALAGPSSSSSSGKNNNCMPDAARKTKSRTTDPQSDKDELLATKQMLRRVTTMRKSSSFDKADPLHQLKEQIAQETFLMQEEYAMQMRLRRSIEVADHENKKLKDLVETRKWRVMAKKQQMGQTL